jgi:hypothetical protein
MNYPSILHNGYIIEVTTKEKGYHYVIKKDGKLILESGQSYPFPTEAQIAAKLYVNRLIGAKDGWLLS